MIRQRIALHLIVIGLLSLCPMITLAFGLQTSESPEAKAYEAAINLTNPEQQLDALADFLVKFPQSKGASEVITGYLDTLFEKWPSDKDKILKYATKLIEVSSEESVRVIAYDEIASRLVEAGMLLDKAEEFAAKALSLREEGYKKDVRRLLAENQATLGRVYLSRGKNEEAKKILLEAYEANPSLWDAARALATIESKLHNNEAAMKYLIPVAISGLMTAKDRELLVSSYRNFNGNSEKGLEEMLDSEYEKKFANPIAVQPYQASPSRSNRVVLVELFTSATCPPCAAADLSLDAIMKRYPHKDVAVLMHHINIPSPDPMTNALTEQRSNFYKVDSTPVSFIDGRSILKGGGGRGMAPMYYNHFNQQLEEKLQAQPRADLQLNASLQDSIVKVRVEVKNIRMASPDLKLHIALVEDLLRYSGRSSIRFHPMVVRSLAGFNGGGLNVNQTAPSNIEYSFDLTKIKSELSAFIKKIEEEEKYTFLEDKTIINTAGLSVVAFVQDMRTQQVLQAAYSKITP